MMVTPRPPLVIAALLLTLAPRATALSPVANLSPPMSRSPSSPSFALACRPLSQSRTAIASLQALGDGSGEEARSQGRRKVEEDSHLSSAGSDGVVSTRGLGGRREALAALLLSFLVPPLASVSAAEATHGSDKIMAGISSEPTECRGGAIVAENAVPGAYSQVCMTLPERTVKLKSTGETLSILQGATSGNDSRGTVSGRTGVAVWNSGLLLLRVLDAVTAADPSFLAGRKALELGCGAGLISVALAKMGASEVMATDGNPEVVGLARENAERNGAAGTVWAAELRWGMLDAADYYDYADVVVGSDLTYNSGTWRVLAETLGAVLKPEGAAIYLALGHSGFNVAGEMAGFLSVVESEGLELVEEGSERWPFDKNVKSLSKFLEQCTSPEEKAVINGTGGARVIVLRKKPFKKM